MSDPQTHPVRPPFREWNSEHQLGRAHRPCYNMEPTSKAIRDWILAVKAVGVRSVICLLSEPELQWYEHLNGGLLVAYKSAGLKSLSENSRIARIHANRRSWIRIIET